jgi:membrane protease subunit HflC
MKSSDDSSTPGGWPPAEGEGRGHLLQGKQLRGLTPLILLVFSFAVIAFLQATGRLGVAQIADGEVGVLVNYLNGNTSVITTPGFQIYLPGVQELVLFDRSSQEFRMEGNEYVDDNHVPRLTVRANDGSNFWFEELTILYELIPGSTATLLVDSGSGDGFKKNWIRAYARSILRDEFGRYSAVEAADPTQYTTAAIRSRERLNELLEPHGLRVTRVITPRPKFDQQYERSIEERKESDQEVERQKAREEQLIQERGQRLAAVEKEKEIEMQALQGELTRELLRAEQSMISITRDADAYAVARQRSGEGERAKMVAEARGLAAKYTKEAEGLTQRALALEQRGRVVVQEALIEKLPSIRFSLLPYSRDPAPKRLEHVQNAGDSGKLVDEKTIDGGQ